MTGFELVFSLFGLLLGLCVAEVLGGLGRALEHREDVSIGWFTPMLGAGSFPRIAVITGCRKSCPTGPLM